MSANIVALTKENMDALLQQHDFMVLDFWASWCAPCQALEKIIDRMAPEFKDILFAKVNIEDQPEIAADFAITSIPRVLILRDKTVVYDDVGALSAESLRELLTQARALT